MALPREILERAGRVLDYHYASKLDASLKPIAPDVSRRPATAHVFDYADKTPLSGKLLDAPTPLLTLLEQGLDAVPESLHQPPQDLRTLSTWLHLAAGQRQRVGMPWGPAMVRAVPSCDMAYPGEIYVAAFAIEGLAPGLHHYSVKEHALRHLRDAPETLSLLRRGRPDLQFLSTVPGALLVTSVFCRSSWLQGRRGYRQATLDCGHVVANLHAVAMSLGISTVTRLRLSESSVRELIGVAEDADYPHVEAGQALVVWADGANAPANIAVNPSIGDLPPLPRPACEGVTSYGSIAACHHDVAAPGLPARDVLPPLTDLTPLPAGIKLDRPPLASELAAGRSMRVASLDVRHAQAFHPRPVSRDLIVRFARAVFRGGTYGPLKPDGAHVALARPFFIATDVVGHEPGIWWYDAIADAWAQLNVGQYRRDVVRFFPAAQFELIEGASVLCAMAVNVRKLMAELGPDLYRLALLECGVAAQRLNLAASSVGLGCRIVGEYHDDAWKQFLGMANTGWEVLSLVAIGGLPGAEAAAKDVLLPSSVLEFRD
jgi:SagB-type dehydrogenase family enzyme